MLGPVNPSSASLVSSGRAQPQCALLGLQQVFGTYEQNGALLLGCPDLLGEAAGSWGKPRVCWGTAGQWWQGHHPRLLLPALGTDVQPSCSIGRRTTRADRRLCRELRLYDTAVRRRTCSPEAPEVTLWQLGFTEAFKPGWLTAS